jgi:hypothetical protein
MKAASLSMAISVLSVRMASSTGTDEKRDAILPKYSNRENEGLHVEIN